MHALWKSLLLALKTNWVWCCNDLCDFFTVIGQYLEWIEYNIKWWMIRNSCNRTKGARWPEKAIRHLFGFFHESWPMRASMAFVWLIIIAIWVKISCVYVYRVIFKLSWLKCYYLNMVSMLLVCKFPEDDDDSEEVREKAGIIINYNVKICCIVSFWRYATCHCVIRSPV